MREVQSSPPEGYCACDMFESSPPAETGLNLIYLCIQVDGGI